MRRTSPLRAKTSLKTKTALKKRGDKPTKQKKPTITKLKKEARKWFNRAVKYRDSDLIEGEWLFQCITCSRRVVFRDREGHYQQSAHAGHFQPETRRNTQFNEQNVNGQCNWCNSFNAGEQIKYARALDLKYGSGTAAELERLAHIPHQFTIEELQEIIKDSKEQTLWYEQQTRQLPA